MGTFMVFEYNAPHGIAPAWFPVSGTGPLSVASDNPPCDGIGIFTNDTAMFNRAVNRYYHGAITAP